MAGAYWTLISFYNKPACQLRILRWWQLITQQINKCPYPRCFKLYGFPSTLSCYHTKCYIYKRYINCITFSFLFWITIDQLLPVGHPPLDLLHSPGHDAHQLRAILCDDDIIFNPDSPKAPVLVDAVHSTSNYISVLVTLHSAIWWWRIFLSTANSDIPSKVAGRVIFPESVLSNRSSAGWGQ